MCQRDLLGPVIVVKTQAKVDLISPQAIVVRMQDHPRSPAGPKPWVMGALIAGLVLTCYWPALRGGLLWDDAAHVTAPELRSWTGLGRIWFDLRATQQYYPVLHSAFWIEHRLWGDATLGYHLVNVLWHTTGCCLFALVLRRLWNRNESGPANRTIPVGAEWFAAALFAFHPVCVESVAWISEQKNTLSLVFYLLAASAYLDFEPGRKPSHYGRATLFFLLALGTKTVTATLPAALLVMQWWKNGRLSWRRDVVPLLPWFLLAASAGLFTAWVERKIIGAEGAAFDLSLIQRLLLAGRVVWFYLGKLVWPADLMFVYPRWDATQAADWCWALLGVIVITAALWLMRRRTRGPLAGWLFFVGALFPALGFFNVYPFLFSYVADHFQYLASLGIIGPAAAGIALMLGRTQALLRWGIFALVVGVLGFLANQQSRVYVDGATLYRATLARNPRAWMAHNNLGVILANFPAGAVEAVAHYEEALRLKPDYAEAHNNLAVELIKLPGRVAEAAEHCEQALRVRPDYAEAHCNLANALALLPGREAEARSHYEQALLLAPDDARIHYAFANALAQLPDRLPEALAEYEQALRLDPRYVQAHVNLANELAKLPGRLPEALSHYEQALRIDAGLPEVHYNLAVQLTNLSGREAGAMAHYEEAIRLQPNYAKAHNNLAILYVRQGRLEEAQRHLETALALNPDYEDARRNLERLQKLRGQ